MINNQRAAFIEAIDVDPGDQITRAIYADYLEESQTACGKYYIRFLRWFARQSDTVEVDKNILGETTISFACGFNYYMIKGMKREKCEIALVSSLWAKRRMTWTTFDERHFLVWEMEDSHLWNTIKFLERTQKEYYTIYGEMLIEAEFRGLKILAEQGWL